MRNENVKIAIIGFYYGTFPDWMQYWLKSCSDNKTIDFYIVTDIQISNLPSNVFVINKSLNQVKKEFRDELKFDISLKRPYKLCDYKPLYGVLLKDILKEYDYWGHCDFDLIWGDIRNFVEKYDITKYDKFLPLGHLSLYKNTEEVNNYYKLDGSRCGTYQEVLQNENNFAFDETEGIYSIYIKNDLPMFTKRIFAEIKTFHKRFRLKKIDKNYKNQVFYYENGKVFRAYDNNGKINQQEFIYIHFRRNLKVENNDSWDKIDSFYISPIGFVEKKETIIDMKIIDKYNHNPGLLFEGVETLIFCLKNISKIKSKIENEIITSKMQK